MEPLGPPFAGEERVFMVLPTRFDGLNDDEIRSLQNIPAMFAASHEELELELGAPPTLVEVDPGHGPRWLIGPARANPALARGWAASDEPVLWLDREQRLLISDAPTAAGVWDTFSLLRSLARFPGGRLPVAECRDVDEAITRIVDEVGDSYPAFGLRGLDWATICAEHIPLVRAAGDPIPAMQAWLAELQDAHTWVRPMPPPPGDIPYQLWVTPEGATFTKVPPGSAAWEAGVRPGHRLISADAAGWWRRTGAPPHARPLIAGRRILQDALAAEREMVAQSPAGDQYAWREAAPADPWNPVAAWRRLPTGTGYLHIRGWVNGPRLEAALDAAFADLRGTERLIVDLRGNPGGELPLAYRFRDRFLREPGVMGTIQYSRGPNVLGAPTPIRAEPAPPGQRRAGPVRFLTDPLTYSSSEDALLGLQGLPHVQVIGEPSGGGSGRMRVLHLLPGWRLTISTALTFDRQGHCIEGAGIPVDRLIVPDRFTPDAPDVVHQEADRGW